MSGGGGSGRAAVPERVAAAVRGLASPVCAYVYDPAVLAARVAALRAALPGVTVCYAVKANGHPAIVAAAAAACDGLEVASGGELALAEAADARRIVFGGPAKTDAELAHALRLGATVNVESPHELRRLSLLADRAGTTATITLRVNRAGAALPGTHAMTGAPTPFGVDEAQLPEVVALARSLPGLDLAGWHLHAVSNNLDAAAHSAFLAEALRWSAATSKELGVPLRTVNAGGGFGVDYTGGAAFPLDELRVAVPEGSSWWWSPAGGWPPTRAGTPPRCSTSSTRTGAGSRCCAAAPTTSGCPPRGVTATRSRCCRWSGGTTLGAAGGGRGRGGRGRRAVHAARRADPRPGGGSAARRRRAAVRPHRGVRVGHLAPRVPAPSAAGLRRARPRRVTLRCTQRIG
ncbi:alanine racemase [Catellatospora bangladeshensis]|uniref:alanine racemase n=1 Tax=Catellatospora bangladeshensis TaxID=310355 RepID=UPI003610EA2C